MDEHRVHELVGDLIGNLSSVSPDQEDFLVDQSWALELIKATHEPNTYEEVGWVSVTRQQFHPNDGVGAGRFFVYRREN